MQVRMMNRASVHAIRVDANMENAKQDMMPLTNHHKLVNKREKDVGLEDIHIITLRSHEGESE